MRLTRSVHLFLICLLSMPAFSSGGVGDIASTSQVWRMFLGLAFIVLLIPLSIWGIKKLQSAQLRLQRSDINILAVQSLGTKEKLVLIEVEGKRSLLGVTANSINKLEDYSTKESSTFQSEMQRAVEESHKEG